MYRRNAVPLVLALLLSAAGGTASLAAQAARELIRTAAFPVPALRHRLNWPRTRASA